MVERKINIFNSFQRSVPYFTETHISRIFKASSGFKMAHFEAYLHVMTVGTSNKCAVNMNIMTRTLQTEANGKFGKEKVKKTAFFFDKTFFLGNFLYFQAHSVIHGWKAWEVRDFLVFSWIFLESLFEVQNFVDAARQISSLQLTPCLRGISGPFSGTSATL